MLTRKRGEPLIHWQKDVDFVIVLIGDGDCREYCLEGWMCPYVDFVTQLYPKPGVDPFVGFEMNGGVQIFLRHHYKKTLGSKYEEFRIQHNENSYAYHASELLDMWLKEFPATKADKLARVTRALKQQNPTIHIPL